MCIMMMVTCTLVQFAVLERSVCKRHKSPEYGPSCG